MRNFRSETILAHMKAERQKIADKIQPMMDEMAKLDAAIAAMEPTTKIAAQNAQAATANMRGNDEPVVEEITPRPIGNTHNHAAGRLIFMVPA